MKNDSMRFWDYCSRKGRGTFIEVIMESLVIYFFFREFQSMASTLDDSSLSSDQDTN